MEATVPTPTAQPAPVVETKPEPLSRQPAAMRELREDDAKDLKAWLLEVGAGAAIKVVVTRVKPEKYKGIDTAGQVATYDEPISVEELKEQHGGGRYTLRVMTPTGKGAQYGIVTTRNVVIPGPPRLDTLMNAEDGPQAVAAPVSQDTRLVDRVVGTLEAQTEKANARAERAEQESRRGSGTDTKLLELMMAPLMRQIEAAQADNRMLQQRITELLGRKPEDSRSDLLLGKMLDGESVRLESLRAQHDIELRTMRENHRADLDRAHDFHSKQRDELIRAHEREVRTLEKSGDVNRDTTKQTYEMRIEGLHREIARLEKELAKSETEAVKLRELKLKGPMDTLREAAEMKDIIQDTFGNDNEETGSPAERIITGIVNSDFARGVAARIATGAAPAQQQPVDPIAAAIAQMPVGQPMKLPDGRVIVKRPDGSVVQVQQNAKARRRQAAKAEAGERAEAVHVDPKDVETAVAFIEKAIENDVEPDAFAATARSMVDPSIIVLLKKRGIDFFLNEVAQPSENSPLLTQAGRTFVRKVGQILVGE